MIDKVTDAQEMFAQEYAKNSNASEAYRTAYPKSQKWKSESVNQCASRLMNNIKVSSRINELKSEHSKRNAITVDTLLAELEEHRKIAISADTPQVAAANASTLGKAKLLGLDKQIIDHTSSDGSMTPTIQVKFID